MGNRVLTIDQVAPVGVSINDVDSIRRARVSILEVEAGADEWVQCPTCGIRFRLRDRERWTGLRHRTCGQKLNVIGRSVEADAVWCVVANIVKQRPLGPGGLETKSGTRLFRPGAKVYCIQAFWGMGAECVEVLGQHRKSRQFIAAVVRSKWLTSARVKLVYAKPLIDRLSQHCDGTPESKADAERLCRILSNDTQLLTHADGDDPAE